jgi:hypothetical protein
MSRAARFAAVLGTLAAAHNVADHVLQTDHQALHKADADGWGAAMAGHVGSYHATQVAALATADRVLGLGLSPRRVAVAVAISAATHGFLDRRWPVRRALELTGSPGFSRGTYRIVGTADNSEQIAPLHGPYLADQALHHGVLWVCALIAAGGGL